MNVCKKICNSIYERKLKNVIGQMVCLFLLAERIELNGRFKGPIERVANLPPCFKNDYTVLAWLCIMVNLDSGAIIEETNYHLI